MAGVYDGQCILVPQSLTFASDNPRRQLIRELISDQTAFSFATTEPETSSDLTAERMQTVAAETPEGFVVNGRKRWVTNSIVAGGVSVLARAGAGSNRATMLAVDLSSPGVRIGVRDLKMGHRGQITANFEFTALLVPTRTSWEPQGVASASPFCARARADWDRRRRPRRRPGGTRSGRGTTADALDAGAASVIVPLVNTAGEAAKAVAAATYPPTGIRSYGPMRAQLRIGPTPATANADTVVLAMIETPQGLENVEAIYATEGLAGVYVGPSDLRIAVGGAHSQDPAIDDEFEAALVRIRDAAAVAVEHTNTGFDRVAVIAGSSTTAPPNSASSRNRAVWSILLAKPMLRRSSTRTPTTESSKGKTSKRQAWLTPPVSTGSALFRFYVDERFRPCHLRRKKTLLIEVQSRVSRAEIDSSVLR